MTKHTIGTIREALGFPSLRGRFMDDLDKAPAAEVPALLTKWGRIADDTAATLARATQLAEYDPRGEEPPGEWIDGMPRLNIADSRRGET